MKDPNIFAVLTACDKKNRANSAFKLPENSTWFRPPVGGIAPKPTIDSREATPAVDGGDSDETDEDRLVLTFDKLLKKENLENGLQFGTNPISSHILLGHRGTKGISGKQCNITVDDNLCIWLHDYHSAHGSAVGQSGQNKYEVRKGETWILAFELGEDNPFGDITIHLGSLEVEISFINHTMAGLPYIKNLRAFVKRCKEAAQRSKNDLSVLGELGLSSKPPTEAPTESQPINNEPVYYHGDFLGEGAFGQVHQVIRLRDGKLLAAKTFGRVAKLKKLTKLGKNPANTKRKHDEIIDPAWLTGIRREYNLMKENPHANVMQVFELREVPEPMIVMEYYPDGSMADARIVDSVKLDSVKLIGATGQILDGLSHLHAKGLAHRDLKPENFLIKLKPFQVVISDFGLSKVVPDFTPLKTFCGTLKYTAPEVFPGSSDGHGVKVDVWSLGVICLEWLYDLPTLPVPPRVRGKQEPITSSQWSDWVSNWTKALLEQLEDEDESNLIDMLSHMLKTDARKRWSAKWCLALGFENGLFKRRDSDDLVVCADDEDDPIEPVGEEEEDDPIEPVGEEEEEEEENET